MTISLIGRRPAQRVGGYSNSGFYEDINDELMTPPIKCGRSSRWPLHEVEAIVRARIAGWDDDRIRQLVRQLVAQRAKMAPSLPGAPTGDSRGDS